MKKIDIYKDFEFNGRRLSSFNGIIHTTSKPFTAIVLPQVNPHTESITGCHGELFYGRTYGIREWSEDIYFEDIVDIRELANWLSTNRPMPFKYINDTVEIDAICTNTDDLELYYSHDVDGRSVFQGLMSLKFTAYDPFYKLITDEAYTYSTFATPHTFTNSGTIEGLPILEFRLNGRQNVKFKLNEKLFEISNATNSLIINVEYHTVYDENGNVRPNIVGNKMRFFDEMKLINGSNKFELINGSVNSLKIHCNARFV